MLTVIWIVFAIMAIYFIIGMTGIVIWEVTTEIMGVFNTPDWVHKVYKFIIEKMFFFFK